MLAYFYVDRISNYTWPATLFLLFFLICLSSHSIHGWFFRLFVWCYPICVYILIVFSCFVFLPCVCYVYDCLFARTIPSISSFIFSDNITWYSLERNLWHFSFALRYRSLFGCHAHHTTHEQQTQTNGTGKERATNVCENTSAKMISEQWKGRKKEDEKKDTKINLFIIWICLPSFHFTIVLDVCYFCCCCCSILCRVEFSSILLNGANKNAFR